MKIGSLRIENEHPDVLKGLLAGMVAGLFATYMKSKFQTFLTNVEEAEKKQSGTATSKPAEDPTTVKAANALANRVIHRDLRKKEKELAGPLVDYGFGSLAGMAYGAVAEVMPVATVGAGTGYGSALWLLGDELGVPAAGLSEWPNKYPVKTHAYGLSGHLVYGLAMEMFRRMVRKSLG